MPYKKVPFGRTEEFNVIIEIPSGSQKKYAFDQTINAMRLNRMLYGEVKYPFNYGHVAQTLADDGDSLDAFVISTCPISRGVAVPCRPVGMAEVLDRGRNDHKILAIPTSDVRMKAIEDLADLPETCVKNLENFYLEAARQWGTDIRVRGFADKARAIKELLRTQNF